MNVKLLSHTEEPMQTIWTAARTCYSSMLPEELWDQEVTMEQFENLFRKIYESGHMSIFDHVYFTFAISGIRRRTSHQLVRTRVGVGISQQSMRYVRMNGQFNVPKEAKSHAQQSFDIYDALVDSGKVHHEEARDILPIGTLTNLLVTYNLTALIHLAYNRRCIMAQEEFRKIVNLMKQEVSRVLPIFGKAMMIKCQRLGYCNEYKNKDNAVCKIRPHIDVLDLNVLRL